MPAITFCTLFTKPLSMEDFEHMSDEEKLKAENDFLKMKVMLERGAEFEKTPEGEELPADIENQFLRNILEFEKQFDEHKITTVYDKIGRPTQFKPANEIPDEEIEKAWKQLHAYMLNHGIDLSVNNPKITSRELYRFATEELFEHQTDDIDIPGMISGFIYDEFYPDYEYENSTIAIDCIQNILSKEPFDAFQSLAKKLTLNSNKDLPQERFKLIVNQFKNAFEDIELHKAETESCMIEETTCTVKGSYSATGVLDNDKLEWAGSWQVVYYFDDNLGYWEIVTVMIQNINF